MIIGLGYKARSGKDTIADYLDKVYLFQKAGFADTLKRAVMVIYGWDERHVSGNLKETLDPFWGTTPREVLQRFGTDACRKVMREDIWVKAMERRIRNARGIRNWVISDVRFPNEAAMVRRLGGVVVRVDRAAAQKVAQHESETALDGFKFDHVIDNNGTLDELYDRVEALLKEIKG